MVGFWFSHVLREKKAYFQKLDGVFFQSFNLKKGYEPNLTLNWRWIGIDLLDVYRLRIIIKLIG